MSSTTNDVAAKLAEHANARKQIEERRKQLEEEAEQKRLEEERLAKELEEMRAEEEQKAEEKREAEKRAEERRKREEEEARATKAFTQKQAEVLKKQLDEAKKKKELKRSRPESETEVEAELEKEGEERTGESAMLDGNIVWRTKAGRICGECRKREKKCLWPEATSRTKACHLCSALKVKCIVPGEESEAGPSKKRKVAGDKGKGKAKEVKETKSEPEFGFRELVEELQGLRQDLREFRTDLRSTHRIEVQLLSHTGDIADSVEDMARFFVPYQKEEVEKWRTMRRRLYNRVFN